MRFLILRVMASVLTAAATAVVAQGRLPQCPGPVPNASWTNCVGERTFPDGAKYVGEYRDGKRNGQGTFTLPSGVKFTGEFNDNRIGGRGTLTFPDGRKFVGELKDGKPHGQGNREALYRTLSKRGNLPLKSLTAILGATGLRLAVRPATIRAERKYA